MYLSTKEVSSILSVSKSTVKRLADNGKIRFIRKPNSLHRRYFKNDILKLKKDQINNATETLDSFDSKIKKIKSKPHPAHYLMHKYWGRKSHSVLNEYIKFYSNRNDIVLDPFMGSGSSRDPFLLSGSSRDTFMGSGSLRERPFVGSCSSRVPFMGSGSSRDPFMGTTDTKTNTNTLMQYVYMFISFCKFTMTQKQTQIMFNLF